MIAYLAFGAEDAQSTAAFLNVACEQAGVGNRVREVTIDPDDPGAVERYGSTLVSLAQRQWPVPWFDNSYTRSQLGYAPLVAAGSSGRDRRPGCAASARSTRVRSARDGQESLTIQAALTWSKLMMTVER